MDEDGIISLRYFFPGIGTRAGTTYLKLETGQQPEGHAATTFSNILFLDYILIILMVEKAIWLDIAFSTIK